MEPRRDSVCPADPIAARPAAAVVPRGSASTPGRNSDRLERLLQAVEGVGFAHDANAGVAGEFLAELGFAPPARNDDWEMRVRLAKPGRDLIAVLIGQPDVDDQPG